MALYNEITKDKLQCPTDYNLLEPVKIKICKFYHHIDDFIDTPVFKVRDNEFHEVTLEDKTLYVNQDNPDECFLYNDGIYHWLKPGMLYSESLDSIAVILNKLDKSDLVALEQLIPFYMKIDDLLSLIRVLIIQKE